MSSTFKPNSAGFRAMAAGPEVAAAVRAEAEKAKLIAEALSQDFRVTGEYASSFVVTEGETELQTEFGPHAVATGTLTNTSAHAAAVEWGNANDDVAHHVLGRTAAALREYE